jgi:hypothetical protein
MPEKATDAAEFSSVEYTTESGSDLGFGLRENETRLHVDLNTGVSFLNRHQPTSDEGGEPLGTFRTTLPPEQVEGLRRALRDAPLGAAAPGKGGGPWASGIDIRAKRGGETRSESFSSQDMEKLSRLESLLSVLDDAVFATSKHPFQAIQLELEVKKGSKLTFTVKAKNVGIEAVALPDLESLGHESKDIRQHGIGVRVAVLPPARPGYTDPPLIWSRVGLLEPATKVSGKPIILPPGGEQAVRTASWSEEGHAGRVFVQAFFSYYGGPPIVDGHLMIRGHALSAGVDVAKL